MYQRLLTAPLHLGKSFFLLGPRGTGKTLWVKTQFKNSLYIDLLESNRYTELHANPQKLEALIPSDFNGWIILDEVQRIPELLNEVHRLIEKNHYKFILTGSSARSLRKKGVNLLAGRALTFSMYPLTVTEVGKDFQLDAALKFGMLPAVFIDKSPQLFLESYVKTYIREEVLQEGLTRNVGGFARFLEVASFSQAQVLNASEIAREAFIHRKVVASYFDILEDLLLAHRLPIFTKHAKRRMITHQKFYFFDVGIFRAIRPRGPLDSPAEIDGAAIETLLFQELRAINDYWIIRLMNTFVHVNGVALI
jgi:predicted AAA+ superfamily ATPase